MGAANWDLVTQIRNSLDIPVIANGDIQTAEDALHILNNLQIDGAMIARAAVARPWILWQISEMLGTMKLQKDFLVAKPQNTS